MGEIFMKISDDFSRQYQDHLDGIYDCVDRIVLNAYCPFIQRGAGFRFWWRRLKGNDDQLDDTHLMRYSGRFARRIRAYCKSQDIPLIFCNSDDRKDEIIKPYIPKNPEYRGVFCILYGRAPASVFEVKRFCSGAIDIRKKQPYVNYYYFHIIDPDWGHLIIRFCPHPPFTSQVILNGHEYLARQAKKHQITLTKEGNAFTEFPNSPGFARLADSMIPTGGRDEGRLVEVCESWIYTACLCFALDIDEQKRSGFHYVYSVYQAEYSRNLLFERPKIMEQIFQSIIDRTRCRLNMKTLRTIFGYKHRPSQKSAKAKSPRFEVVVEKPAYDLTVFKIHFGKLTVKIYSKGERLLRVEAIAHNSKDLRCGRSIERFPQIIEALKHILERFLAILRSVDAIFIDRNTLQSWSKPSQFGKMQLAGLDLNKERMRAVIQAVIALSMKPRGFSASDVADLVGQILQLPPNNYRSRHASYDLKKLRGKQLLGRIDNSQRYQAHPEKIRQMAAFIALQQNVLNPLLANAGKLKMGRPHKHNQSPIDYQYKNIQREMIKLFNIMNLAA
jgi:hypothetical protein